MDKMKKVLMIGDNEAAPYHPLNAVEDQFRSILSGSFTLDFTVKYLKLSYAVLAGYDLVISYTDCWNTAPEAGLAAALCTYVMNGGAFLVIHNGISLQGRYELAQMTGAKFITHPTRTILKYTDLNPAHPILLGVSEFELYEEPYQFEFDSFTEKTVLFNYSYNNQKYAAAWTHEYGLGKVVYLSPGHENSIFSCDSYRKIIRNSVIWLTK